VVILGLLTVLGATVSVNVAANVVSPSYDFSNLAPKLISFRVGGLITGVVGVALQPLAAAVEPTRVHLHLAGLLRRADRGGLRRAGGRLLGALPDPAEPGRPVPGAWQLLVPGRLELDRGWRPRCRRRAGGRRGILGARAGAVPADAWSRCWKPLYNYGWVVGFAAGFAVYLVLSHWTASAG